MSVGGAIYNGGILTVTHCTLSGNSASEGGGISNDGTLELTDSIVAGNTLIGAGSGADIYNAGPLTRVGANLVQGFYNDPGLGTEIGPAGKTDAPILAPLGNYGGPTQTMALLPGSPARDAAVGSSTTSDQRGFPIVGTPDIGAYEAGTLGTNYNAYIYETLPATATAPQHSTTFDFDGDGQKNEAEWLALTSATDPNSRFSVSTSPITSGNLPVSFATAVGRIYTIETSPDLITWTPAVGDTFAGTGSVINATIGPVTGFTKYFVRVRAALP
jgi:hypothetical protein